MIPELESGRLRRRSRRISAPLVCAVLLAGCSANQAAPGKRPQATAATGVDTGIPASLRAGLRPIGRGRRFRPPITGHASGRCEPTIGRRLAAHVEVFGANRVVLLPAGIGTAPPRQFRVGWLTRARCFGDVVTVGPTGTVYFRPGVHLTLAAVFSAWGEPLTARRVASFTGGRTTAYIDGRVWNGAPSAVRLTPRAEIVVEIGPHVPPHQSFVFPGVPPAKMR